MNLNLIKLQAKLEPLVSQIQKHDLFATLKSHSQFSIFVQSHVYAVWDFMCLMKALQRKISCMEIAWHPPIDTLGCNLVNHIISEEESDVTKDGRYLSHFEMYLEGMLECGIDIENISLFIQDIKSQVPIDEALKKTYVSKAARNFVTDTFHTLKLNVHEIAASFAFARENLTPLLFQPILDNLKQDTEKHTFEKFIDYFERHIELDGGEHGEAAKQLMINLCKNDQKKWKDAEESAIFSLKSRLNLLDNIYLEMNNSENTKLVNANGLLN